MCFFRIMKYLLEKYISFKMKIRIEEKNLRLIINNVLQEESRLNPYRYKINSAMDSLSKLLSNEASIMINIDNGKEYLVYYDSSISNTIGKNYCITRLLKDGKPYGLIQIKPMDLFKTKN